MAGLRQLAGQTAVYGVSSIIGRFLNYLLVPLYVYTFPPDQYGVVTEFYAYVVVLQIVLTYGMETGYFRFANKFKDPNTVFSTVLSSITFTSTLFLVLVFVFKQNIADALGYSNHTDYIVIFAIVLATDAITAIFFAKLRKENKALKFATYKILNISLNILLNLFFILLLPYLFRHNIHIFDKIYNPQFGVGYIFLSNLIASIFVFILFIPEIFHIKIKVNFPLLKQILKYSLPLLITGLTGVVNEMADRILIKYLTTVPPGVIDHNHYVLYQLGIYGANAKLAVVMMMFVQAFRYAAEPFFFSKAKNVDDKHALNLFADVMKFYVIFAFIMFLFVLLNLDIFKFILSKSYYSGLKVVFPLFLSRFLVGVFFILSFWYKLTDKTKYGIVIFSIGATITLVFDSVLIPKFGYIAAAWVNFATYFTMVTISYIWSRKYLKVPYDYKRIAIYIIFALSLYFISKIIHFNSMSYSLVFNNLLLVLYIVFVIKNEKIKLQHFNIKQFFK